MLAEELILVSFCVLIFGIMLHRFGKAEFFGNYLGEVTPFSK